MQRMMVQFILLGLLTEYRQELRKTGAVFTTLHPLRNLRMGPIGQSVCPWQDSQVKRSTQAQHLNIEQNFDHQMSLCKSKCSFLKRGSVLFHTATEFESIEQLTTMKTKAFLLIRRDRSLFVLTKEQLGKRKKSSRNLSIRFKSSMEYLHRRCCFK